MESNVSAVQNEQKSPPHLESEQGLTQAGIVQLIFEQQTKLEEIHTSVEKTRKYFLWTLILTLIFFIVPLILMILVLPQYLGTFSQNGGLNLKNFGL